MSDVDPGREVVAAARTDVGRFRSQNEDAALLRPEDGLFAVADGMGGHAAGEVASALAVETVAARLAGPAAGAATADRSGDVGGGDGRGVHTPADADGGGADASSADGALVAERGASAGAARIPARGESPWADREAAGRAVRGAVEAANRRIHEQARDDPAQKGMGTTATVLLAPWPDRWVVGQVGDSRAYLLRDGELSRVTTDHTIAPGSSTLTRALGTRPDVQVDVLEGELRAGDVFLLCSDGLTDVLSDDDVREALAGATTPPASGGGEDTGAGEGDRTAPVRDAADALVDRVLERGARDNVTVVVVRAG